MHNSDNVVTAISNLLTFAIDTGAREHRLDEISHRPLDGRAAVGRHGIDAGNGDHVAQELDRIDHLITDERRRFHFLASIRPVERGLIRFADPI